jgi:hypothetical protein
VLARWGIAEPRLVAALCAAPAEVLRQAATLEEHLAAGRAIANPAGWLIEAVRGCYRPPAVPHSPPLPPSSPWPTAYPTAGPEPRSAGERGALSLVPAAEAAPAWTLQGEQDLWAAIQEELRDTTTPLNFQRWFAPTILLRHDRDALVVGVPGERERECLEHRLRGTVERAASAVLGHSLSISFEALAEDTAVSPS